MEKLVTSLGNLNGSYGYLNDVIGLGVGLYEAQRPCLVYDSSTGKMSFKIYDQDYMSFEYNSGTPRVYLGNSINNIELSASGLGVGTSGYIKGGMGTYKSSSGFWMGYDSGAYKFCIGNVATDNYLDWDGTNLTVKGGISANSIDVGTTGYVRGGQSNFDTSIGFWLGYSGGAYKLSIGNSSGKKFLWDGTNFNLVNGNTAIGTDGILRANSAVISGTLYASAGYIGSGTNACAIDNTGLAVGTSGAIRGSKTSYSDTTAGFWMGYDSGAYKFKLGDATNYLYWDGSNLTMTGSVAANSIDVGTTGYVRGNQTDYNTLTGFWLGYSGGTHKLSIGSPTGKKLLWDGTNLTVNTGSVNIGTDGTLQATNAVISGTITANTGYIGGSTGWTIATGKITSAGIGVATVAGDATYAFWAGDNTPANAEFSVTHGGSIKAIVGTVGGWTLNASQLYSGSLYLDAGNGRITCNDIIIDGVNDRIRSLNYVSGPNGSGFTLEPNLLEVGNISARGMIRTAVFQRDTLSSVGGTVSIMDADTLFVDMSALDASTLTVSGTTTFSANDVLRIKDGINDEWLQVSSASGNTYTVTRDKAGSYAANNNPAWKQGVTVVNYGQNTEGGILLTSSLANSPYLSIFTHAGSPWSTTTEKVRLGNLTGISGASGYGLWTNNCFLTGYLQTGSGNKKAILDSADNTFRFYNNSGDESVRIDTGVYGTDPGLTLHNGGVLFIYDDADSTNNEVVFNDNYGFINSTIDSNIFSISRRETAITAYSCLFVNSYNNKSTGPIFLAVSGTDGTSYVDGYFKILNNGSQVKIKKAGSTYGVTFDTSTIATADRTYTIPDAGNNATFDLTPVSDRRLKTNIKSTSYNINDINKIKVVDFNFKNDEIKKKRTGAIAQDVLKVLPEFVNLRDDGYYEVKYKEFIPLLIKSVQDLDKKITKLEKENKKLKQKLGIV